MIGIYKIENLINGKKYIGQSNNIERRWKEHKMHSRYLNPESPQYNFVLYKAFRKYGIENFSFSIIQECSQEELDNLEKYWIKYYDSYNNGYNETLGGQGRVVFLPKIYQYDVFGNFIQEYENIHIAAAQTQINESNIRDAANHKKNQRLAGNYQWSYQKSTKISHGFLFTPVNCYSKQGKFIKTYNTAYQAEKETGDNVNAILKSCNDKRTSAKNYQWRFWKEFQNILEILPNDFYITKSVKQYDLNGNFIQKYSSVQEAARENNISYHLISACCHKRQKSAGGYIWCFIDAEPEKYYNNRKNNQFQGKTAVIQLNLNDEIINTFSSIKDAAIANNIKSSSHIGQCCLGKRKTCGGFKWRYLNETQTKCI